MVNSKISFLFIPKIYIYLSVIIVLDFIALSSKPSLIYRDRGSIRSARIGCGTVVNFAMSFLGLGMLLGNLG